MGQSEPGTRRGQTRFASRGQEREKPSRFDVGDGLLGDLEAEASQIFPVS
jgi:hypothetical protein